MRTKLQELYSIREAQKEKLVEIINSPYSLQFEIQAVEEYLTILKFIDLQWDIIVFGSETKCEH